MIEYGESYCDKNNIGTSRLNEAQITLHLIAENMKMSQSISAEGYEHFQQAISALSNKKVKDLTLGQIKEICDKQDQCSGTMAEKHCPIFNVCRNHCKHTWAWIAEDMEREVKA